MLAEVGLFFIGLALVVVLYAAWATWWAIQRDNARWSASGRNGVYAAAVLLGLALLTLLAAFLRDQFDVRYVAEHSSRELPLYLKVSALWAGQEGSLLLWSFLQALFSAIVVRWPSEKSRPLVPWATIVLNIVTAFFAAVTLFLSNPFAAQSPVPVDGLGLNPLLRHPGMVFHPPALYIGYVGLAVPFAFALAALITRRAEDWPTAARPWTLISWLFLGVGLLLGARWAYDVLGWGGYWAWDPVENAGLMPWFTATALLHGIAMQEQRGGFRWWNVILAVLSFLLVLFGTFTTRSGMIESVHAFARSPLGYYFLAFMLVTLVAAFVLMLYSRRALSDARPLDGLLSRDGMFFLTVILFLTITATVFIGSVLPTLTEAISGQRFEAGPEWFDRVTGPQFGAMVLLLGLCPILGRAASALKQLGKRGWPALVGAAVVVLAAYLTGFTDWVSLIGFALVGLAGGTALAEYIHDVAQRSRKQGQDPLRALWHLVGRQRRKYGGYLVHIGVVLMALGIIGTRMYEFETELVLVAGEPVTVQGYTLVLEDMQQEPAADHLTYLADLTVYRDGTYLATMRPSVEQYVGSHDQTVGVPAVRPGLREDFYLVLAGWSADGGTATVKVYVNALASFLWLGGLFVLAGGTVALWPAAPAAALAVPQARRRRASALVGLALGLLLFAAAIYAMWGPGHGVEVQAAGRPLVGQLAPDFELGLLDGSSLTLSQMRGQVVVVNLWATWCPPCQDELPALETVWAEYQDQEVVFVGAAYQDEIAAVQGAIAEFDLTYPIGQDQGDRIAMAYGITGVPETFVVDQEGRVAYVHIGPVTAELLRAELNDLLD